MTMRHLFFQTGVSYIARDVRYTKVNKDRFVSSYGTTPFICEMIYSFTGLGKITKQTT